MIGESHVRLSNARYFSFFFSVFFFFHLRKYYTLLKLKCCIWNFEMKKIGHLRSPARPQQQAHYLSKNVLSVKHLTKWLRFMTWTTTRAPDKVGLGVHLHGSHNYNIAGQRGSWSSYLQTMGLICLLKALDKVPLMTSLVQEHMRGSDHCGH